MKNKPIVPGKHGEVPPRRRIHRPGRRQEVAVQARDDDDKSLEPHADVDDSEITNSSRKVVADLLEPEQLRIDHVASRSATQ